ncbi:MAG TPA: YggT family protein [Anaerolineales bacterium]|nr:YggT family protein [Anaerolineales bacterium]
MVPLLQLLVTGFTVLIVADVLLSFLLDPFHTVRRSLDGILRPLLAPIRRLLPPVGMLDFSPFILLILVQVVGAFLIRVLSSG